MNKATRKKLSVPGFLGSPAGGRSVGFFFFFFLLINSLHASRPRTCTEVHECTVQFHVHVHTVCMTVLECALVAGNLFSLAERKSEPTVSRLELQHE